MKTIKINLDSQIEYFNTGEMSKVSAIELINRIGSEKRGLTDFINRLNRCLSQTTEKRPGLIKRYKNEIEVSESRLLYLSVCLNAITDSLNNSPLYNQQ